MNRADVEFLVELKVIQCCSAVNKIWSAAAAHRIQEKILYARYYFLISA